MSVTKTIHSWQDMASDHYIRVKGKESLGCFTPVAGNSPIVPWLSEALWAQTLKPVSQRGYNLPFLAKFVATWWPWPPLCAILCGQIWPFLALLKMGYRQNWPSANSYSHIGYK